MKNLKLLLYFASLLGLALSASVIPCPESCKCIVTKDLLGAKCNSIKFLKKIKEKQAKSIVKLELSSQGIKHLDQNLSLLKNLKVLDLSSNLIKKIDKFPILNKLEVLNLTHNFLEDFPAELPTNLKELDISYNNIKELPNKLLLKSLSILHFQGNPVNCEEKSIEKFAHILKLKLIIPESIPCFYPKELSNKTVESIISYSILNEMLGDDPLIETDDNKDEDEFLMRTNNENKSEEKIKPDNTIHEGVFNEDEGSGEGSGDEAIDEFPTFKPLIPQNESSPLLSIREMFGVLMEDILGKEQKDPSTTPMAIVSEEAPKEEVSEIPIKVSSSAVLLTGVETTPKIEISGMERASFSSENNDYAYYLVAVLVFAFIVISIIIIKKKATRGKRNRRHDIPENGICEEMKPMGKQKDAIITEKPSKEESSLPERIPLISGENGKEITPKINGESNEFVLRKKLEDTLSAKPERVTVTAGEIPPSVLKTPQLVHRQINSDGDIVTKALDFRLDGTSS